jgi:hypothetical protein
VYMNQEKLQQGTPPKNNNSLREMHIQIRDDYIKFGDYCRCEVGMTRQCGYYLLEGLAGYPSLKEGLRLTGDIHSYHSIRIHKDDAKVFKDRYETWRKRVV